MIAAPMINAVGTVPFTYTLDVAPNEHVLDPAEDIRKEAMQLLQTLGLKGIGYRVGPTRDYVEIRASGTIEQILQVRYQLSDYLY